MDGASTHAGVDVRLVVTESGEMVRPRTQRKAGPRSSSRSSPASGTQCRRVSDGSVKALRVENGFDIVHLDTVEVIAEMAAHGVAFVDVVARTARCVGPSCASRGSAQRRAPTR